MRANEFVTEAVRQRLDPKCWTGKHKEGTKIKGGVRVNNCVPNESMAEDAFNGVDITVEKEDDEIMVRARANGRELGHVLFIEDGEYLLPQDLEVEERFRGQGIAQTMYDYVKSLGYKIRRSGQQTDAGAGFWDKHRAAQNVWEQDVAEGLEQDYLSQIPNLTWKPLTRSVWNTIQDEGLDEEQDAPKHTDWVMASLTISPEDSQALQEFDSDAIEDFNRFDIHLKSRYPGLTDLIDYDRGTVTIVKPIQMQDVAEGKIQYGVLDNDNVNLIIDKSESKPDGIYSFRGILFKVKGGKVTHYATDGQILQAMGRFNTQIGSYDSSSQAKSILRGINESVPDALTPDQQFDLIEDMVENLAQAHGVDSDMIWEDFESVDDHELFETAAWRRKEGKSKSGGLNAKGVASYRRENPGSKLQTAVTTKPSKLKPGSKAAKRRKSFCARMGGVKGPMKKPNGKPTRKALALRKWNC